MSATAWARVVFPALARSQKRDHREDVEGRLQIVKSVSVDHPCNITMMWNYYKVPIELLAAGNDLLPIHNHVDDRLGSRVDLIDQEPESSPSGVRQLSRRLKTSPAQVYRLLDTTNYKKTVDKMLELLHVLDAKVEVPVI